MTTTPRGPGEAGPPLASAEQLNAAINALGIKSGDGPPMPRAKALGALLFVVEMLTLFDVDRVDAAAVRSGYLNMALMAGMVMGGDEQLPAGMVVPAQEFTGENYEYASVAFGRMLQHRFNATLLDLEEMVAPERTGEFNIGWPVISWLRAICALSPLINAGDVSNADIAKGAKAAKKHASDARQHLADLLKLVSS
jgi:hypothetical protein